MFRQLAGRYDITFVQRYAHCNKYDNSVWNPVSISIWLWNFIASTDRTHSTDSSGRVDTADSNDGNVGAGSIEGVDSINTMTVWTELTVLTVLKVPITATTNW